MRLLTSVLLIALLSAVGEYFLPWWIIAVVSFLVTLAVKPPKAFLAGFLGVGIFWLIAVLMKDIANEHILSARMAGLFHLPNYSLFVLVTVLVGALVSGLASWSASLFSKR